MTAAPAPRPIAQDACHTAYTGRLSFPIHQLNAQLARIVNPLFREFDIDQVSSRLLVLVLERGAISAGALTDLLALPQSTVSHQIQRLEKIGYITRQRDGTDQRVVTVKLTKQGRAVADACNQRSIDVYRAMIANLTPEQVAQCREAMDLMLATLAELR